MKQETLAAVEDFLARTQEYRLPAGAAAPPAAPTAAKPAAPDAALTLSAADKRTSEPQPPAPPPQPPRDAAFANIQVSIVPPTGAAEPNKMPVPAVEEVAIRWKDGAAARAAPPPKTNATNAPLDVQSSSPVASLERTLPILQEQAEKSGDFPSEWRLRLTQLALDRDSDASTVSTRLAEDSGRLLAAVMETAAATRNLIRNPALSGDEALQRLETLRQLVSDRADPVVSAVALCRKVTTFGSYEEMPGDELVAGRPIQVIVYSEIRNLRAARAADGSHETRLSTRMEVLTADGKSVWQREEPEIVDQCRNRRTDFFVAQRITLPPTLPEGDYVLKLLVEDKLSGRIGESSSAFSVRSPVSLAKGASRGQ